MASLTPIQTEELIAPEGDEHEALEALRELLGSDTDVPLRLITTDGSEIELPNSARAALFHAVSGLARQQYVSVEPVNPILTVAQVRALLGAAMNYVEDVLESGELPSTVVDGRRQVHLRDALALKQKLMDLHEEGMRELVRLSEEMGLYDLELTERPIRQSPSRFWTPVCSCQLLPATHCSVSPSQVCSRRAGQTFSLKKSVARWSMIASPMRDAPLD